MNRTQIQLTPKVDGCSSDEDPFGVARTINGEDEEQRMCFKNDVVMNEDWIVQIPDLGCVIR